MRIFRKNLAILCFLSFLVIVPFSACGKVNPLCDRVVDLRLAVFEATCDYFPLSATYGYKETPYVTDGVISNKEYFLEFKIVGHSYTNVQTYITLEFKGEKYKANFELNPVTHSVKAKMPIDNFNEKTFNATIYYGSEKADLTFNSILPENAITYDRALDSLIKDQKVLVDSFRDQNGNFIGEITARIIVRKGAPYWYIGLSSPSQTKALLIDGITAKTLAIREIF